MANALPALPAILTNKGWQKAKGAISKLDGETGIGDALARVEALYKQINMDAIDPEKLAGKDRDQEVIDQLRVAQPNYHAAKIEPLRTALQQAAKLAAAKAAEWQKKTLIPKSATKAANDVAAGATALSQELALHGPFMKSFEAGNVRIEQEIARKEQAARDLFDKALDLLTMGLARVKAEPSKKTWEAHAHQAARSVCNAVRNIPALKTVYWTTWQPFGDFYEKDAPTGTGEEDAMLAKVTTVAAELRTLKANYKRLLA